MLLMMNKQWNDAFAECTHMFRASPNGAYAHACAGLVHLERGDLQSARQEFQYAFAVPGKKNLFWYLAPAGFVYGRLQQPDSARMMLAEIRQRARTVYVSPLHYAAIFAGMGLADSAFVWLEKGYAEHDANLLFLDKEALYAPLKSDPRFAVLLRKATTPTM